MSVAIVTGSSGLIGSETVKFFHQQGFDVIGIDNNMRQYFFGKDGSIAWKTAELQQTLPHYQHYALDIRDDSAIQNLFKRYQQAIQVVIHTAAQPSHDWAAREPMTDFSINANGTLVMLEATRQHCPDASFIFTSTNKVYGDTPNQLPLVELDKRWELDNQHPYAEHGINESMSIDYSKHSLFGASKIAADILTQEYGRYFGMKTAVFRGGCLTGPAHSGAELHGFLAYLVKCAVNQRKYTIFGYQGKQVRDNIHAHDLVNAFWHFYQNPRPGEVYNIGGSRHSNCSILEAIDIITQLSGHQLSYTLSSQARSGDHIWWVSDINKFKQHYPNWQYQYNLHQILQDIINVTCEHTPQP